uniref:Uncharacterized protein n=1 Tax=Picea sitchensis TaxID=3332 RepID=B8LPN8_PICSI|nr:unknown [Picea sitchensis]
MLLLFPSFINAFFWRMRDLELAIGLQGPDTILLRPFSIRSGFMRDNLEIKSCQRLLPYFEAVYFMEVSDLITLLR